MSQQNASNENTVATLVATLFALVKTVVIGQTVDKETGNVSYWGSVKARASNVITLGGDIPHWNNKAKDIKLCTWPEAFNAFLDSFEDIADLFTAEQGISKNGSTFTTFRSVDPEGVGACIGMTVAGLDMHLAAYGISTAHVEIDNGREKVDAKSALGGLRATKREGASQPNFTATAQPPISSMQD